MSLFLTTLKLNNIYRYIFNNNSGIYARDSNRLRAEQSVQKLAAKGHSLKCSYRSEGFLTLLCGKTDTSNKVSMYPRMD